MDLFKPEMYAMPTYDNGYFNLLDDLSGQMFEAALPSGAAARSEDVPTTSPFDLPWLTSDSASTSEEPSSPFSATGMSPMSPQEDEESTCDSVSDPASAAAAIIADAMILDYNRRHESALSDDTNPKKRARVSEVDEVPSAKHTKLTEDSTPSAPALPLLPPVHLQQQQTMVVDGINTLLAQQYSWNQMQIQQVMACLNASQIHQAMSLAAQPPARPVTLPSAELDLAAIYAPTSLTLPTDFGLAYPNDVLGPASPKKPNKKKASAAMTAGSAAASKKRPKLDPKKDALQCLGHNRKKNKRCGNAALMEFIGPRPLYCAEHIDQDPQSLYTKCCSNHHKLSGEGKGCREVVLKELGCCHKHFDQITAQWPLSPQGLATARASLGRVSEILELLETEAAAAKKSDPDLFQRKHKIIPKFVQLVRQIEQWMLDARAAGVTSVAPTSL